MRLFQSTTRCANRLTGNFCKSSANGCDHDAVTGLLFQAFAQQLRDYLGSVAIDETPAVQERDDELTTAPRLPKVLNFQI
jgi:hypothetical protein